MNGNASSRLTGWFVDGDTNYSYVDSEITTLIELVTKLRSYVSQHSLGAAMRDMPTSFNAPFLNTMKTELRPSATSHRTLIASRRDV